MPGTSLALILVSSVFWSALDALRKALAGRLHPMVVIATLTAGMVPIFAVWAAIEPPVAESFLGDYLLPGGATVVLNVTANILFIYALKISPLSATIPFLSFTPVFMTLFAMPLLGEVPTAAQLGGIGLVVAGSLVINARAGVGLCTALVSERGSVLMVIVSLLWALNGPVEKIAVQVSSLPFHLAVHAAIFSVVVLAILAARGELSALGPARAQLGLILACSISASIAVTLQIMSYLGALVGLVETIKRVTSLIFSLLLGRFLFGETLSAGKLGGTALMSAGVIAVLLG